MKKEISKKLIWGGTFRQFNKKRLTFPIIFLVLLLIIGTSYALWNLTFRQTSTNQINTSCFKINFKEANDINLKYAYPLTDEDGQKLMPFTFTIENICNTTAFYQINLEEIETNLKQLSNKYIKVSLNNSKGKKLNTYTEVTKTLDNATVSHKLTSGALRENDKKTFDLRLWLDEDTPANQKFMNATIKSKITIIAVHKEDIENELKIESTSLNENFSAKEETIEIKAISKKYDIIEISEDGITYNPVETPSKEVTIQKKYTTEGIYNIYFKDEVGNVIKGLIETNKLDQTPPTIIMNTNVFQNKINLDDKSFDSKSGISKLEYKLDDEQWHTNDKEYTYETTSGWHTIYIKITDNVGNVSTKTEKVEIANNNIIYNKGTSNYSLETRSGGNEYPILNADHIYFSYKFNKTVFFQNKFQNNYRYLKVIAKASKNATIGKYYNAAFGLSKSITYNTVGLPSDSTVIKRGWIIFYADSSKLLDYPNYTEFTLDLENINEPYYIFLHNCDSIFTVQKIWLTNN